MKSNQQRQKKRMNKILIQVHSFSLNLVLCLGLYSAHAPLSFAADSGSNLDQLTQNVGNTGVNQNDLTSSLGAPTAATAATADSISTTSSGTKIEGKDIDPKTKMLLGNVALFAATMAAPMLIKKCPKAPSVWIYSGAAALYLANEIGLFTRFKNASDAEMAAYLGRGDEDKQIISLEAAAAQTEKAQKAAKRRALVAKIAAAGFMAATAMALVENYTHLIGGLGSCGKGGKAVGLNNNEQFIDSLANPTRITLNDFSSMRTPQTIDAKSLVIDGDNFDFMMSYQEQVDFFNGKTQSVSLKEYRQKRDLIRQDINRITGLKSALIFMTKFSAEALSSNAQAADDSNTTKKTEKKKSLGINWSGSGIKAITAALGVGAGFIALTSKSIASSPLVTNPLTRAALFGGMSIFAVGASNEANDASNRLGQRSSEYIKLADALRSEVGQNASNENSPYAQSVSPTLSETNTNNDKSDGTNYCITGKATTSISPDTNCTCASGDSCKKTNLPDISAMPEFAGKSLLSDSLKSLKSSGDSVYAGNLEAAQTAAIGLGKNAARISHLRDALVKKINEDNVAAGGKGNYDLNALQNRINDKLLKKVNAGFNNLGPSQQASLARFAPALDSTKSTASADKKKKKGKNNAAVGGTGKIATGPGKSKSNSASGFNFNFDDGNEDTKTDPEAEALAKAMAQEDNNYVIEGDINDDRNKNIFKIITGRYLKSAYPVIFDEQ